MKRAKKAEAQIKIVTIKQYSISCPHCHTVLIGGFNDYTLRFKCVNCQNPIEIIWTKEK